MQINPFLNINCDLSKIKKSFLPNTTFVLKVLSENGIIFAWMELFLRPKNNAKLHKNDSFKKTRLRVQT